MFRTIIKTFAIVYIISKMTEGKNNQRKENKKLYRKEREQA